MTYFAVQWSRLRFPIGPIDATKDAVQTGPETPSIHKIDNRLPSPYPPPYQKRTRSLSPKTLKNLNPQSQNPYVSLLEILTVTKMFIKQCSFPFVSFSRILYLKYQQYFWSESGTL